MRRTATLSAGIVAVVVLAGAVLVASSPSPPSTGVAGQVFAGPTCPVETIESPCPPAPWSGTVRATAVGGSVTEGTSAADGRFLLALEPGSYTVVAVTEGGVGYGEPVDVIVTEGAPRQVNLFVDTGIR